MSLLTKIHIAAHDSLQVLPSFDGLTNLKSLTLASLGSLTKLPSLDSLHNLERLELMLSKIEQVPSLKSLQKLLYLLVDELPACCNGALGACDPSACAVCLDATAIRAVDTESHKVLDKFNGSVCTVENQQQLPSSGQNSQPPPGSSNDSSSAAVQYQESVVRKEDVDVCGGVLYRECTSASSSTDTETHSSLCYNSHMMVVACITDSTTIAIRKAQILHKCGLKCDSVEEKWLGCPG